ncbi:ATP-binding protein [Streptomyces sp. XY006]|uniref:ATP-binding protein n=1 Tax=Streptomyces sp. XY006 TaxID=2021410 RepID=UPI00211B5E59|nr:ATP-binding protein [Streptomyces sp. XY006]
MIDIPDLAVGGLAFGTLSAFALGGGLLRARRQLALQRTQTAALRARLDGTSRAFTAEVEHLAARRVPAAARQAAHPHVTVPGPLNPQLTDTPLGLALEQVLKGVHTELAAQRTRIDAAAQAGMRGATREIQAALYRLQDALRGLQQRYDDPELAQTLFELDHENEQSLRRAQVAAVVCGAWVGLAREESHLVDAVTGGQARLAGYRRVRVHNHLETGTALVSHAVEPVAIIVAELLDNALRHSAPDTEVVVNLEAVHHGVCVTVDDAGLGMSQDERARAQRMVAGDEPILLTDLGDPPRMGLAAVGQLTRQFDLSVDLSSPSPYGGVRAVLRIDSHLLTRIDPEERPPAAGAPRSTRAARGTGGSARPAAPAAPTPATPAPATPAGAATAAAAPARATAPEPRGATPDHAHGTAPDEPVPGHHDGPDDGRPGGHHAAPREDGGSLPQRRRRRRAAAVAAGPAAEASTGAPQRRPQRPEEAAAALGALQSGTAAARRSAARPNTGAVPPVPERDPATATADAPADAPADNTGHDDTDHEGTGHEGTGPTDRHDQTGQAARTGQTGRTDQTGQADQAEKTDKTDHKGGTAR